jgi:hypothetical protein
LDKNLYEDLLQALEKQTRLITQTLSEEFSEIASNNSRFSQAVELAERRSSALDKKLEKKRKYQALVRHCQRLQCNSCAKLYTPVIFATHYKLCSKQQQMRSSSNGIENHAALFSKVEVQVDQVDQEEECETKEEFVAKVLDIKKVLIDSIREDVTSEGDNSLCNQFQEGALCTNSDELLNIMGC